MRLADKLRAAPSEREHELQYLEEAMRIASTNVDQELPPSVEETPTPAQNSVSMDHASTRS